MANTEGESWAHWLVRTNDPYQLWKAQPTYLISQAVYLLGGLITLFHASRKGGRWPYFWLGTVLHGIYADNFWHFVLPEYDNFWHSQTPIIFLGGRLPLHIILLYPTFMYHAAFAVSKLHLPRYAEPFAVGLITVLIDIPYDIVAVKFVHWTWHDTDPNIYDRHYWVPWNSYYFHATFAASFFYFFNGIRRFCAPMVPQWETAGKMVEWKSVILATLVGMPGGVLLFIPIYHPLHDLWQIHAEVTFFLLFTIFAAVVINGLMSERKKRTKLFAVDYMLILQLALHYIIYWVFVVFFNPENEVSVGLHQPIGPCNKTASLVTPFGQTLFKKQYLCPDDYEEDYFDFHCVNKIPANGESWYTICGTPFLNRAEYITVISTIVILATAVFYNLYFKTYRVVVTRKQKSLGSKLKLE